MRVALFFNKMPLSKNIVSSIQKKMKEKYSSFVIVDAFEDIEMFEYCTYIRVYDMVFVISEDGCLDKQIVNCLGNLRDWSAKKDVDIYLLTKCPNGYCSTSKSYLKKTIDDLGYSAIVHYNFGTISNERDVVGFIDKKVSEFFYRVIYKKTTIVEKVDFKNKVVVLSIDGSPIEIQLQRTMDLNVLITFLYYGIKKKVSVSDILSAVTKEPEETTNSPIETSIASIRKTFSSIFGSPSIDLTGKGTYSLNLPFSNLKSSKKPIQKRFNF